MYGNGLFALVSCGGAFVRYKFHVRKAFGTLGVEECRTTRIPPDTVFPKCSKTGVILSSVAFVRQVLQHDSLGRLDIFGGLIAMLFGGVVGSFGCRASSNREWNEVLQFLSQRGKFGVQEKRNSSGLDKVYR
jgi:hypothetical protein